MNDETTRLAARFKTALRDLISDAHDQTVIGRTCKDRTVACGKEAGLQAALDLFNRELDPIVFNKRCKSV